MFQISVFLRIRKGQNAMLSQDNNLRLPAQMIEQLQAGQVNRLLT